MTSWLGCWLIPAPASLLRVFTLGAGAEPRSRAGLMDRVLRRRMLDAVGTDLARRSPSDWVSEAVQTLVRACQPRTIILFGSVARGDDRPGSDIDLLVVVDEESQWASASQDAIRAVASLPTEIDVIVTTQARLEANRDAPGTVVKPAVHEGKIVYDRAA